MASGVWQQVVRTSLVSQVEEAFLGGKYRSLAVTGARGVGKTTFLKQVSRKLRIPAADEKLVEVENSLEAIRLRERSPEIFFVHVDELPEAATRTLMAEAVSSEIQMRCVLEAVGGHPGNLRLVHEALMASLPKYLAEKAQTEFEIRTGKRATPSAEMRMLEIDSLAIDRDAVVAQLGDSVSVLNAEQRRFLERMALVEAEVAAATPGNHDHLLQRLFLVESVRTLVSQLTKPGFIPVAAKNFSDIKHPVICSSLRHGLVYPAFSPLPRLVVESTLTRKYLHAWVRAKSEELSLAERVAYNALLLRHRGDVAQRVLSLFS